MNQNTEVALEVLKVPVFCSRPLVGTVEWLAEQKPCVVLVNHPSGRSRQAILVSADRKPLLRLCIIGRRRLDSSLTPTTFLVNRVAAWSDTLIPWTDAAWDVLVQIRDRAHELLQQPGWMHGAYNVSLQPADPMAAQMLLEATQDASARGMLYRYLVDELDYEDLLESQWPDGEARQPPNNLETDEEARKDAVGGEGEEEEEWVPF